MAHLKATETPPSSEEGFDDGEIEVLNLPPAIACMPKFNLDNCNFSFAKIDEEPIGLAPSPPVSLGEGDPRALNDSETISPAPILEKIDSG